MLHTSSLVKRRLRDLIHRIMREIDKVNMEHFFELDHGGGHDLRGHRFKVKVQRSRLQLRQGFFSESCLCLEQFTIFSCGGFVRQHFQQEAG